MDQLEISKLIWILVEALALISSLLFTWFAAQNKWQAWIFGIFSAVFTALICINVRLFSEVTLQGYYLLISIISLRTWMTKNSDDRVLSIQSMSVIQHILVISLGIGGTFLMGKFWQFFEAARPFLDSFTTSFSLITVWLMSRKYIENWIYWIIIDLISIYLYFDRGLYIMMNLFVLYTILAVYGLVSWKKTMKKESID
jgi:nicotinamide mononucleotide transporter